MEEKKKSRISNVTAALMIGTAVFFDVLELLAELTGIGVFISPLIAIFAGLTFWLWFTLKGVSYIESPKRFATSAGTFLLEIIPGLDALTVWMGGAFWTIGTIALISMVKFEDKTGVKIPKPGKSKTKIPKAPGNEESQ